MRQPPRKRKVQAPDEYEMSAFAHYEVSTLIGCPRSGMTDGARTKAQFNHPNSLAMLADGSIVLSDTANNRIRIVSPTGQDVCSVSWDGSRSVLSPRGLAVIGDGLLVADEGHNRIRHISADGRKLTTFAGCGKKGTRDGPLAQACFNAPTGMYVAHDGTVIVCDTGNHRIRAVHPESGTVTTLAGSSAGFRDSATPGAAQFDTPSDVCMLADGSIVVADTGNHAIRRIEPHSHAVTTMVGTGKPGFRDGPLDIAEMAGPAGIDTFDDNTLLVTENDNNCIRRISLRSSYVFTLAGHRQWGFSDGPVEAALFNFPRGILVAEDMIFVADSGNHCVRRLCPSVQYAEVAQSQALSAAQSTASYTADYDWPTTTTQPRSVQGRPPRPPYDQPVRDLALAVNDWEALDSPLHDVVRPVSRMTDDSLPPTRPTSRTRPPAPEPFTPHRTLPPPQPTHPARTGSAPPTTLPPRPAPRPVTGPVVWAADGRAVTGQPVTLQIVSSESGSFTVMAIEASGDTLFEEDIEFTVARSTGNGTVATIQGRSDRVSIRFDRARDCQASVVVIDNLKQETRPTRRDAVESESEPEESEPESVGIDNRPSPNTHPVPVRYSRSEPAMDGSPPPPDVETPPSEPDVPAPAPTPPRPATPDDPSWPEELREVVQAIARSTPAPMSTVGWVEAMGRAVEDRDARIAELEAELAATREAAAIEVDRLRDRVLAGVAAAFDESG